MSGSQQGINPQYIYLDSNLSVTVVSTDLTRDGLIKEFIKMEMKFWAALGSRGCREKNSQLQ